MGRLTTVGVVGAVVLGVSAAAQAGVSVTQGSSAPTYATTLNFDEVGGPTGEVLGTEWASLGVSQLIGGGGAQSVGAFNQLPGMFWLGDGNSFAAPWGIFMTFSTEVNAFSTQYWDNSGPGGPMGGGAIVIALNDGNEVGSYFVNDPAWGGVGDSWFNIVADGGSVFDEVRMLGFGFFPEAFADNMSWNAVPAPASVGLVGLAALVAGRRRR